MEANTANNERMGIVTYIACCLVALLCWATVGYAEVLMLKQKTYTQVMLIEQAVAKLDKVARK